MSIALGFIKLQLKLTAYQVLLRPDGVLQLDPQARNILGYLGGIQFS